MGASQPLRHHTGERAILPEEDGVVRQRARLDLCCSSPGWGCRPTPTRVALVPTVSSGGGGSMFPTDVIAQERIADWLRESESERLDRRSAEAKAFVRRAKVRAALNLVVGTFALARRKRVVRSA